MEWLDQPKNTKYKQFAGVSFEPKMGTPVEWEEIFEELKDRSIEEYLSKNVRTLHATIYNALSKWLRETRKFSFKNH